MKNPSLVITILFFLIHNCSIAQNSPTIKAYNPSNVPVKNWDKTLGGNLEEVGLSVELTDDGGYVLAGTSSSEISGDKMSANKGNQDFWVIKINENGSVVWEKSFGGSLEDYARTIVKCNDGGFLIGGESNSPQDGDKSQPAHFFPNGVPSNDFWIVKIDANGNKQWDKRYGWNGFEYLNRIIQTSDGGYLLGGESDSNDGGEKTENLRTGRDAWVVRIDANGNKLWDKTLGGSKYESIRGMVELDNGDILLASDSFLEGSGGDITATNRGGDDIWLVKMSSGGSVIWDKKYGSTGNESFPSMLKTSDGNIFLCCRTDAFQNGDITSSPIGDEDFWLIKLDIDGNKIWDKHYGGYGTEGPPSIFKTIDNKYILAGSTISGAGADISENYKGVSDLWAIKIDDDGNKYWDKRIGCDNLYFFGQNFIRPTNDMGFIFIGASGANISGDKTENSRGEWDFWLVKLGVNNFVSPACVTPALNFSFVASGCNGIINWSNNTTGSILNLSNVTESTTLSATCNENGIFSQATNFVLNVAWYQHNLSNNINGGIKKYTAITTINANNQIVSGANVKYHAGGSVLLSNGFKADSGTIFKASIGACND